MRSCLILGSGRSGTSMVAGSLHGAGYFMGEHLWPGNEANPKGFFEDEAVNAINEELLARVTPRRPPAPLSMLYRSRPRDRQRWLSTVSVGIEWRPGSGMFDRMRDVVRHEPFCLKDPRFSYTLPAWRPVLPDDVVFVCVFREPARTANSIVTECRTAPYLRSLRMTYERALEVWTSTYRHVLERQRQQGTWLFVHFDGFLDGTAIPAIEDVLGVGIDRGFADPGLKRSDVGGDVPEGTERVYRELCSLAGTDPAEIEERSRVVS
jgi:hypothetical protein